MASGECRFKFPQSKRKVDFVFLDFVVVVVVSVVACPADSKLDRSCSRIRVVMVGDVVIVVVIGGGRPPTTT